MKPDQLLIGFLQLILATLLLTAAGCSKRKITPPELPSIYDAAATERIDNWKNLIREKKNVPVREKLFLVNSFFNQLDFLSDQELWGQDDYWATPLETLVRGGGDCEDFTIAKYYTLRSLNIADEKMRLTYVKSLTLKQPHMVLSYYHYPRAVPLILDNVNPQILPADYRKDLVPVYSFNVKGLWLEKQNGASSQIGTAGRLKRWRQLLRRIEE